MIVLRMGTPYKTPSQKGYSIYLTFGKKKIRIPVNPEELEIQYPTGHKTYDVLGIGQVVVPKRPSLKQCPGRVFSLGTHRLLMSIVGRGSRGIT